MFVYIKSEPGLWTVGHYTPKGAWVSESDCDSPDDAAARCAYLNGHGKPRDPPADAVPGARWVNDCGVIKLDDAAEMYPQLFEATPGTSDAAIKLAAAAPALRDSLRAVTACLAWHVDKGRGVAMDGKRVDDARALLEALDNG